MVNLDIHKKVCEQMSKSDLKCSNDFSEPGKIVQQSQSLAQPD